MKHGFKMLKFLVVCSMIFAAAACGKMSDPKPIEGSGYPHVYPKI